MSNKQRITLPKVITKRPKRVGRGYGSGKGYTSSRGQKGQKARNGIPILFEGYKSKKSQLRRLPQLRGKAKLKPGKKPQIVNLGDLEGLKLDKLNIETLSKAGLVDAVAAKKYGVKILGNGKLTKSLESDLPMSKKAAKSLNKKITNKRK